MVQSLAQVPVATLDAMSEEQAGAQLHGCCACGAWVRLVLARRPFGSVAALQAASDEAFEALAEDDVDEALASHGRIGERSTGEGRGAAWSRSEQRAALAAEGGLAALLEQGNREYERRFGQVFLVRAAGRSAEQIHDELCRRLRNDPRTERGVLRRELAEITRLRLDRLVRG